jgi:four helix bundle protein
MITRKESIIAERAFEFSLTIIKVIKLLPKTYENVIVIKQIIRSATSIGANIEEALGAISRKEFIHCMNIAKREARETKYWLRLIQETNKQVDTNELLQECEEIINMLTSIVKTSTRNI